MDRFPPLYSERRPLRQAQIDEIADAKEQEVEREIERLERRRLSDIAISQRDPANQVGPEESEDE